MTEPEQTPTEQTDTVEQPATTTTSEVAVYRPAHIDLARAAAENPVTGWALLLGPAEKLANIIAPTEFAPKGMRNKPESIAACILTGLELGLGPMTSLSHINVIEGKPDTDAELMRALILKAGHELWVEESTNTKVTLCGIRRGSSRTGKVTWTMDDAKRAGLDTKDNWRHYPRAMLLARATAELSRAMFADVIAGLSMSSEEAADLAPAGQAVAAVEAPAAGKRTVGRRTAPAPVAAPTEAADLPADGPVEIPGQVAIDEPAEDPPAAVDEPPLPPLPGEPEPEADPSPDVVDLTGKMPPKDQNDAQRRKLHVEFQAAGITGRADYLRLTAKIVGRAIGSTSDLSQDECSNVIDSLVTGAWKLVDPALAKLVGDGLVE